MSCIIEFINLVEEKRYYSRFAEEFILFCLVLFDLIINIPVNNLSVMFGQVFLCLTSTKQALICLAQAMGVDVMSFGVYALGCLHMTSSCPMTIYHNIN